MRHNYKAGDFIEEYEVISTHKRPESDKPNAQMRTFLTVRHPNGTVLADVRPYDLTRRIGPYNTNSVEYMLTQARIRAEKHDVPFSLTPADVTITHTCPLLGIPLHRGKGNACDNSPTLDRLVPSKGYVSGNVAVISFRANRIKNDASLDELKLLTSNLENLL